ncbi:hypothetical protein HYE67_010509 [Fusarium culmorum]|uniref:Uncharacterized protein n=1 Tax=Fusarium culmorum TaxID=5516 RepID=A0A2T4H5P3_FUSCU|nr:hypothetical protein FCULG_00011553 [Fusarium culmorum]QPC68278.1 hypothetical protein HYE67_010509 [Fusarium culmorum]
MDSIINSLLNCIWPTVQSYYRLSQHESGEPGQSPALTNNAPSNMSTGQLPLNIFGNSHPLKPGRVVLKFASITKDFRNDTFTLDLDEGWIAVLDIEAKDVIGLMQEGLYVSDENTKVHENYIEWNNNTPDRVLRCYRHYTLTHPKWSVSGFRLEHLSADRVYHAFSTVKSGNDTRKVYWYDPPPKGPKINALLDGEPLPGLWPWPKELGAPGKSEESSDVVEI